MSVATAPNGMLDADVRTICALSQPHNLHAEITGILTYQNGRFAQLLEGPKTELHALMSRIAVDTRHHSLKIMADGPTHIRRYADWSMAYLYPQDFARNQLDDFLAQTADVTGAFRNWRV
ncbi:hypothetical protein ACVWYO_004969 [Sphingomonas sp. UYP23]